MAAVQLLDGKACAGTVRQEIRDEVSEMDAEQRPGLVVIQVGDRPDSSTYVRMKTKACVECGIRVEDVKLPVDVSEATLLEAIDRFNADTGFHGILVQLPLPEHMDQEKVLDRISVEKDVDGFLPYNLGSLAAKGREPLATSCTPQGVMELLKRNGVEITGKKCVILGRSNIVGMPLALLMVHADATVCICHSKTKNLEAECVQADILCVAMGRAEMVPGSWIKEGAIVVDIGMNSIESAETKSGRKLVGDVKFSEAKDKASWITPVPGGVGPMTIAMLLKNCLTLCKRQRKAS
ncbi:unnamed protein product [Amoebophrya sp. A25]|nr:unnamed protein product [Amoebophrya sp. A25]|eukprot:GSA25T00027235001.1